MAAHTTRPTVEDTHPNIPTISRTFPKHLIITPSDSAKRKETTSRNKFLPQPASRAQTQHSTPRPPTSGQPPTGKIATKSGHKQRSSLLGGGGGGYKTSAAYEPLSGSISSASNTRNNFTSPHEPYVPAGGYHDRQGFATTSANVKQSGGGRMYLPNTMWTWSFAGVALLQAVISIGLEAYVFGEFESSLKGQATTGDPPPAALTIPTYLAIFIFGFLYQLVLVWDALRLKNTIQVIGICIYNLGMMIYAAVETDQVEEAIGQLGADNIDTGAFQYLHPCLIAAPCVIALGTVLLSVIAWKLYDEFAWTIYKHISADLRLKRRYLQYQIYIALLKFDFFFFLGFTVQFLVVVGSKTQTYEFALTIAALPITILLLFLAAYFTRRESKFGQIVIIILYFAGMAYFIFKLVRMYDSFMAEDYAPARHSLTTFAVLTILLLIVTIAAACMCLRNFDKGLRPHIQRRKVPDADDTKYSNSYANDHYALGSQPHQGGGAVPSRMTID